MPVTLSLADLEKGRTGPFFHSRKNRVFRSVLGGETYVVKVYRGEWRERAPVEYGVLRDCHGRGVPAPKPLALLEGAIVMTPVDGKVAGEVFDRLIISPSRIGLTSELERLADDLARWLASFHTAFGFDRVRGDTILKNFIVTDGQAVGLDFEEADSGDPLSDLGQLCASAMMTDPPFTEQKMAFSKHLADRYWACSGQRRADELAGAVTAAIRHYSQFRSNGQELLSVAAKIDAGEVRI